MQLPLKHDSPLPHPPQLRVPPQPSLATPHSRFKVAQVSGTHPTRRFPRASKPPSSTEGVSLGPTTSSYPSRAPPAAVPPISPPPQAQTNKPNPTSIAGRRPKRSLNIGLYPLHI